MTYAANRRKGSEKIETTKTKIKTRTTRKAKWGTEPYILISSINLFPENRALSPIFSASILAPSADAGRYAKKII